MTENNLAQPRHFRTPGLTELNLAACVELGQASESGLRKKLAERVKFEPSLRSRGCPIRCPNSPKQRFGDCAITALQS
jgi:hypothetical protein